MSENSSNGGAGSGGLGGWWWASAAVVVAVVASLVFILLRPHTTSTGPAGAVPTQSTTGSTISSSSPASSAPDATAPPPAGATSTGSPVEAAWSDTGCNGTSGPVKAPASVMTDVTWKPFLTAAIPSSPTLGPKRAGAGSPLRQCFQHSPAGALMAATNIAFTEFPPSTGATVIEKQYVAGPGQAKALSDLRSRTAASAPGQIVGYQLAGCTASACNVNLAVFGGGMYATAVVPMVWRGGDWLVDGSQTIPDGGIVAGLPAGFSGWGPTP